mgnify:CR=1 FL=1
MIIPDKNLFIVTSALKPLVSPFSDGERFQQTVDGLRSIRKIVPDAIIVTTDVSIRALTDLEKISVAEKSNYFIDMTQDADVMKLSQIGQKGLAENLMLYKTLLTLKQNPDTSKMMSSVKRIFKFSGRSVLLEGFNAEEHDIFGKFVFKKRIPTWMHTPEISDLLITRMFSFCPSLIDTYLTVIQDNIPLIQRGFDTEHAHFENIPKQHLFEFDELHCFGWLSGNGKIEHY